MSEEHPSSRAFGLAVAIVVAGAIVAGVVYVSAERTASAPVSAAMPTAEIAGVSDTLVDISVTEADPRLGSAEAPVTVVQFTAFGCSFCRDFHQDVLEPLTTDYIEPGLVRFVFKDLPLPHVHPEALPAAQAARCAGEQDHFWTYVNQLFDHGDVLGQDIYQEIAQALELDQTAFERCVEEQAFAGVIGDNVRAAVAAGITGAPTLVINGELYEGALSYDELRAILDRHLVP